MICFYLANLFFCLNSKLHLRYILIATIIPQLVMRTTLVVAARDEPLFVVFSLQLPFESHTVSFVSQFAPGALQSICGKLGNCPLLGLLLLLLFHCAVVTAIKQHNATSKISLFIFWCRKTFILSLCFIHVRTTREVKSKWACFCVFVLRASNYYVAAVFFSRGLKRPHRRIIKCVSLSTLLRKSLKVLRNLWHLNWLIENLWSWWLIAHILLTVGQVVSFSFLVYVFAKLSMTSEKVDSTNRFSF